MTIAPRGFTLIELLVALFITAILFSMGYGAINQAVNHRGAIEDQQARLLAVQTTMRVMSQDFGQLAARPIRDPVGDTWQPALIAKGASQGQAQDQALVTFTRTGWANPAGIQRPALQRVAYVFDKDKLRRDYWPVLDATLANKITHRDLLTNVKSVAFRYMDSSRQWVEQWPPQNVPVNPSDPGSTLRTNPMAVEVTIELQDWGKIVRVFEAPQ